MSPENSDLVLKLAKAEIGLEKLVRAHAGGGADWVDTL